MLPLPLCAHVCMHERRKKIRHGRESEMERKEGDKRKSGGEGEMGHERERERKLHAHACAREGRATFLVTCVHAR